MRKYSFLIILISIIFLYESTYTYWVYLVGLWAWLISLVYFVVFLFAIGYVIYNIVKCFQVKFKGKRYNILTLLLLIVLIIPFLAPKGLFSKELFYKGKLLVAYLDGVAGNDGFLTLYGNNIYEYNYAFAIYLKGKYKVKNDTVYFDSPTDRLTYDFDYGTLSKDKSKFMFEKDSIAFSYMTVIKNELIK